MRALLLTSNSLRHEYFLKMVDDNFNLVGIVSENKGKYYSEQEKSSALMAATRLFLSELQIYRAILVLILG
jgi:hypothetical protein